MREEQHGTLTGYTSLKCRCSRCREASAIWQREYRRQGRDSSALKRQAIIALKEGKPCADCGGLFPPECMDFDHRPGEVKLFNIAWASGLSKARLQAEIAKCDLVCANCHRIRTKRRIRAKLCLSQ